MRKSGWAAAAGLVSAGLLLTACGGSSSSTGAQGSTTPTTGSASTTTPNPSATAPEQKPSSGALSSPPPGTIYFIIQKYRTSYVMAEAAGQVVYTYAGDTAGKAATCTGSCASEWAPVKGVGAVSPADNYPNKFTVIGGQVAYNGMPLYTKTGALPFSDHAGGQWNTIPLPVSDVLGQ